MREILFRGKYSKKSPDWIEGSFHRDEDADICEIAYRYYKKEGETKAGIWVYGVVDPETVGQYTGLKDKNGKKIFEGDIVRATIERGEGCQSPRIENGVIGYDCIGMIGLILYKDKNGENVWSDFFNELSMSGLIEDYYFEVIGNIYDNPELIGGEANG